MPTFRSVLLPVFLSASVAFACRPSASETPADRAPPTGADGGADAPAPASAFDYPATRRGDTVDELHGTRVADPYRWLEDLDAPETRAWVEAENAVTFGYLETIAARAPIRARLTELWNYERFGLPFREGAHYFYSRNDGLQNQNVIYITRSLDAEAKVFLDPNTLSEDGTVALGSFKPGPKGKLVAYGIKRAGSDWEEFKVRDIKTGKDLPDHIQWSKFSEISWTKDAKGFFYARYAAPKEGETFEGANYNHMIYYHALGTPQADDVKIYERPDHPRWGFGSSVTEDGRYLVTRVWEGTSKKNGVFVMDLGRGPTKGQFVELLSQFDAEYSFVGNRGSKLLFRTDNDAPRGRVIEVDLKQPEPTRWKTIIPEAPETLHGANLVGGKLFARFLKDVKSQVKVFSLNGTLEREVEFPGIGTVYGFGGKQKAKETFYTFTSFTRPGTVYRYDIKSGTSEVFKQPALKFNPDDYETRQVFFKSKDGTSIPMFISAKKGLQLDGTNPTYLYAYGGFNISLTPGFSVPNLAWMEMGGVYAVANLRGGGEYGTQWHEAGMKLRKQNVFDDFIAAAEYLVAERYTSPQKLAIGGRSNGGLLIGAAITQRPELFAAALPGVGVMDMLRFHKFTIGHAWTSDYGSPDDAEEFKALLAYSPLHNLEPGTRYPATLIYTADHDDRVVPGHSFKFAAELQHAHRGDNPVMIRIDTRAGHGAGKPTSKKIEEWADLWGFLVANLDMQLPAA